MSDKNNEIENAINEPDKTVVIDNAPPSSSRGFIYIVIFLMLAVSSAAIYYLWTLQVQQKKTLSDVRLSLNTLSSKFKATELTLNSNKKLTNEHGVNLKNIEKKLSEIDSISQRAINTVNRSQRDWVLAEIDYLLRIAHQRIAIAKDVAGAIAALKGADSRIQQLGDISLFKIRKQLSKNITHLNTIHQADVTGISLSIDQTISRLAELPFNSVKKEIKIQVNKNEPMKEFQKQDKTLLASVLDAVQEIGDIKIHQRSIKAASSGEQQNQIEQLLRTYLLGARLAALRFDQKQFRYEIYQANQILQSNYDMSDNRITQLQSILKKYEKVELTPALPELTKAWSMLQVIMRAPLKKHIKNKKNKSTVSKSGSEK